MSILEKVIGGAPPDPPPPPRRGFGPAPIDVRLRWPLRWLLVFAAVGAAAVGFVGAKALVPVRYVAEANLLVVRLDQTTNHGVQISDAQMQSVQTLANSVVFAEELARESGVSVPVKDLAGMIKAVRPHISSVVQIQVRTTDAALTDRLAPNIVRALDRTIDRVRAGALRVQDENGRDLFPGQSASYQGPLYIDLYHGRADVAIESPRAAVSGAFGAGLAVLLLICGALFAHRRPRVTTAEDLDTLFRIPVLGRLPRLGGRPRAWRDHYLEGLALGIDATAATGVDSVAVVGSGVAWERAGAAGALAVAMAAALDRDVLLVDFDLERQGLTRRAHPVASRIGTPPVGVRDVVTGMVRLEEAVRPLPRRAVPRGARRLARVTKGRVHFLPVGRPTELPIDDISLAKLVSSLRSGALLVGFLPRTPGSNPVQETLAQFDTSLVAALDGWSLLDDVDGAVAVADSSMPGRAHLLLLEN